MMRLKIALGCLMVNAALLGFWATSDAPDLMRLFGVATCCPGITFALLTIWDETWRHA